MDSYTLVILRGLSGAGKTTYAHKHFPEAVICSSDDLFIMPDGMYSFNEALLGLAHNACKKKCRKSMIRKEETIIIDNTNSTTKEMKPYLKMAKEFNYKVKVIRLECSIKKSIKRNTKGTPIWIIRNMKERFMNYPGEKIISTDGFFKNLFGKQ